MTSAPPDIHDAEIVTEPAQLIVRELTPEEAHQLEGVGLFNLFKLPNMEHCVPVVIQNAATAEIVGYWLVFDAVHVEPLWIKPEFRKRPGIARRLWKGVEKVLLSRGVPIAFAFIGDDDLAANLPQATRLGFKKLHATPFFVEVKPEGEKGGE